MIMMKKEHTWSWASEPAGCTVHLRAVNQLPWGGTVLLTPPSAVICGSSHQNWLSGPAIDMTNPVLIPYYVPFWPPDTSQTWRTDFISSSIHSLLAPVCVCVCVCAYVRVCECQTWASTFVSYWRSLGCLEGVLIILNVEQKMRLLSCQQVPISLINSAWFYDMLLELTI